MNTTLFFQGLFFFCFLNYGMQKASACQRIDSQTREQQLNYHCSQYAELTYTLQDQLMPQLELYQQKVVEQTEKIAALQEKLQFHVQALSVLTAPSPVPEAQPVKPPQLSMDTLAPYSPYPHHRKTIPPAQRKQMGIFRTRIKKIHFVTPR